MCLYNVGIEKKGCGFDEISSFKTIEEANEKAECLYEGILKDRESKDCRIKYDACKKIVAIWRDVYNSDLDENIMEVIKIFE